MIGVLYWLLVHVPWWLDGILLLAICGAIGWFIPPTRHFLWQIALGILVLVGAAAIAQKGYEQKTAEDMAAANKALDRAADARRKQVELDNDPKNLRKPDADMRND